MHFRQLQSVTLITELIKINKVKLIFIKLSIVYTNFFFYENITVHLMHGCQLILILRQFS